MRPLFLVLVLGFVLPGCGGQDASPPPPAASSFAVEARQAVEAVAAGDAALLDVRTDGEFAAGHAPEAVHLPLARIEAGARPDLDRDAPLYVYCKTGRRAAVAVRELRADGFTDVTNIGGLQDWERAGGAVTTADG